MEYCIIFDCEQCEGTGEYTVRRGSVNQNGPWITDHSVSCTQCGGHGEGGMYNVNAGLYESIEDVAKDYPQYRTIEIQGPNTAKADELETFEDVARCLFKGLNYVGGNSSSVIKYGKH